MKSIEYVNKVIASRKGMPEDTIKKINSFFFKNISSKLYSHDETAIYIKEIGTITFSNRRVRTEILRVINNIRGIRKSKRYSPSTIEKIEAQYMKYLKKLLIQRNELAIRFKEYVENTKNFKLLRREQMDRVSQTVTESNS